MSDTSRICLKSSSFLGYLPGACAGSSGLTSFSSSLGPLSGTQHKSESPGLELISPDPSLGARGCLAGFSSGWALETAGNTVCCEAPREWLIMESLLYLFWAALLHWLDEPPMPWLC